jgi:hypothetical protein
MIFNAACMAAFFFGVSSRCLGSCLANHFTASRQEEVIKPGNKGSFDSGDQKRHEVVLNGLCKEKVQVFRALLPSGLSVPQGHLNYVLENRTLSCLSITKVRLA